MLEILAAETRHLEGEPPTAFEAIRAKALFASTVQASESPGPDQVVRAVATTLRRLRIRGCADRVAAEFGDHPDTAVARMAWALVTIRTAYPGGRRDRQGRASGAVGPRRTQAGGWGAPGGTPPVG
jgi:hypothetical protein